MVVYQSLLVVWQIPGTRLTCTRLGHQAAPAGHFCIYFAKRSQSPQTVESRLLKKNPQVTTSGTRHYRKHSTFSEATWICDSAFGPPCPACACVMRVNQLVQRRKSKRCPAPEFSQKVRWRNLASIGGLLALVNGIIPT